MCKIAVLSTVHHYQDARIFKEISSLKKRYNEVFFVVPVKGKTQPFTENNIKIYPLPHRSKLTERLAIQKNAYELIKKIKPDILHFHDPELIPLAYLIKKKLNAKIIFDIHENISGALKDSERLPKFSRGTVSSIYKAFEKKFISKFDHLIIAETSYKKIYGEQTTEILNFPKIEGIEFRRKTFSSPIVFVYSGMIWERRGIFKMLELINKLHKNNYDIRFNLIGSFASSRLEERVREFIEKNGLQKIVNIHGRKPFGEMLEILSKSHIGLALLENIENYRESLSSKIFDYMAMGLPYLVSDFPLYENYTVKPQTGITVNYYDDSEIYKKTVELISNPNLMEKFSANGIKQVRENWNWEKQEEKIFDIYGKLCQNK